MVFDVMMSLKVLEKVTTILGLRKPPGHPKRIVSALVAGSSNTSKAGGWKNTQIHGQQQRAVARVSGSYVPRSWYGGYDNLEQGLESWGAAYLADFQRLYDDTRVYMYFCCLFQTSLRVQSK